ncbi:dTDP-4-dehydrorhamnose 3,5-epimerase family protein [Planctomycetota bacterium]
MKQFQQPAKELIDGVVVKNLRVLADERGRLMEILRADDPFYEKFGQVYLTTAYPGVVKAWHYHKEQTDNFSVVKGMLKLVLYDDREGSPTRGLINEFFLGDRSPILVKVPKGIFHGFKGIGTEEALVVNTVTEVYRYDDPDEYRVPPVQNDIPYDWARKDG